MPKFDLNKFIKDVFDPQPNDAVAVMVDFPWGDIHDDDEWRERRQMAKDWYDGFNELSNNVGFQLKPFITYKATGKHGKPLPENGEMDNSEINLVDELSKCTLVVSMNSFSATAPLTWIAHKKRDFRAASMPNVTGDMEKFGLAADYTKVKKLCMKVYNALLSSAGVHVEFSSGHKCYFDTRFRKPGLDNAELTQKAYGIGDDQIQNLPSGETYIVPNEGENEPSKTSGELPVYINNELIIYKVSHNNIVEVEGAGVEAQTMRAYFSVKDARCNIAELGFGCNDMARGDSGKVIEDEKAGFHWAYGISDHLGGVTGEDKFINSNEATHEDIIYTKKYPITVSRVEVIYEDKEKIQLMKNGWYTF